MPRFTCLIILLGFISCQFHLNTLIELTEGGYTYKPTLEPGDENFYMLPVQKALSRRDSVDAAFEYPAIMRAFDEPNISITSPSSPVIRLVLWSSFTAYLGIVTIHENEVILKETKTGYPACESSSENLSGDDEVHYRWLWMGYPLNEFNRIPSSKKFIDSLLIAAPQLNDPSYFLSLKKKAVYRSAKPFTYRKWTKKISSKTFQRFIQSINESGFWNIQYKDTVCQSMPTDGDDYSMEFAGRDRYQFVISPDCTPHSPFRKAYFHLLKETGLWNSFEKYLDKWSGK